MPQHEREPRPTGWAIAYQYPNAQIAKGVYEDVRDVLLVDEGSDASVFRFMVNGRSHVAIVAEGQPPPRALERSRAVLAKKGEPLDIPVEIFEHLMDRRRAFKSTGLDYLERRS